MWFHDELNYLTIVTLFIESTNLGVQCENLICYSISLLEINRYIGIGKAADYIGLSRC